MLQGLSSDIPGYFLSPVTKFQVKYSSLPFGKVGLFTTPSHVSSPHLFQQQAATRFSILALNWVRFFIIVVTAAFITTSGFVCLSLVCL